MEYLSATIITMIAGDMIKRNKWTYVVWH